MVYLQKAKCYESLTTLQIFHLHDNILRIFSTATMKRTVNYKPNRIARTHPFEPESFCALDSHT